MSPNPTPFTTVPLLLCAARGSGHEITKNLLSCVRVSLYLQRECPSNYKIDPGLKGWTPTIKNTYTPMALAKTNNEVIGSLISFSTGCMKQCTLERTWDISDLYSDCEMRNRLVWMCTCPENTTSQGSVAQNKWCRQEHTGCVCVSSMTRGRVWHWVGLGGKYNQWAW